MLLTDIFGYFILVMYVVASLLVSYYIFVNFSHTKERNFIYDNLFRWFIVAGFATPSITLFMISIDKLCSEDMSKNNFGFEFDLELPLKLVMFFLLFSFFTNTFARVFYNQSLDMKIRHRIQKASSVTLIALAIYGLLILLTAFLYDNKVKYKTTYVIAPFMFLGGLSFAFFASIGMSAFPLELILLFVHKPQRPNAEELFWGKNILLEENKKMLAIAKKCYDLDAEIQIKEGLGSDASLFEQKKVLNKKLNDLRVEFRKFEDFYDSYSQMLSQEDANMILDATGFFIGISGCLLSILIVSHMILGFFNMFFLLDGFLTSINAIFGVVMFLFISLYLVVCIVKGIGVMSSRYPYLFEDYKYRMNKTWSDAFLVTLNVLNVSVLGLICFYVRFLPGYMEHTLWGDIVKTVVRDVRGVRFIYEVGAFEVVFVLLFFYSVFMGLTQIRNENLINTKIKEKMAKHEKDKKKVQTLQNKTSI